MHLGMAGQMADDRHNRRSFLRRAVLYTTGAGLGAGLNVIREPDPGPQGPPQNQLPLARPVPGADGNPAPKPKFLREMEEKARQEYEEEQKDMPEGGHAHRQKERQKERQKDQMFPNMSEKGERAAKGAVVGTMVVAALDLVSRVDTKKSAEDGATQNDPERVEWERWQQRRRDREERERNRNKDHDI